MNMIMCDICGIYNVGQTSNVRSLMNGHKSDYRRFLNGDFLNQILHSFSHLKSQEIKILKLQILEILETEGFKCNKDSRQFETKHDAKERYWTWTLTTLVHNCHFNDV